MKIFDNQKFNQDVKSYLWTISNPLLKVFTDKRGKDYQDIKEIRINPILFDLNGSLKRGLVEMFKNTTQAQESWGGAL